MHVTHTTATHRREKKMVKLTEAQRQNAIGRLQASATQEAVANHFGVTRQTISNLWRRHNATGNIRDRPSSGRPRVTSAVQDRYIRLRHLRDRTLAASATTTAIPGLRRISDQTLRNRLREAGLAARRRVIRNVLTPRHLAERLQWCRLRRWTRRQWRNPFLR